MGENIVGTQVAEVKWSTTTCKPIPETVGDRAAVAWAMLARRLDNLIAELEWRAAGADGSQERQLRAKVGSMVHSAGKLDKDVLNDNWRHLSRAPLQALRWAKTFARSRADQQAVLRQKARAASWRSWLKAAVAGGTGPAFRWLRQPAVWTPAQMSEEGEAMHAQARVESVFNQ